MRKRIVAIVLSIVFMVTMLPFNVFAEESELMNSLISTIEEQTGTDIEVVTGSDKGVSKPESSEIEDTSEETIISEGPDTTDPETVSDPVEEEKQGEIPESESGTKGGEGDPVIPVESISLNITEKELIAGESFTITATVLPENATDKTIIWTSSNEEIATVNNGTVTSVSEGNANITAASSDGSVSAFCNVTVIASETTYDIAWEINDGVLTISGTGPMEDYASASDSPWYSRRSEVTKVVISEGITHIGARSFYNFTNTAEFEIGEDIENIGERAFQSCSSLRTIIIPESVIAIGDYAFHSCTCSYTFDGDAPELGTSSIPSGAAITYHEDKFGFDDNAYNAYSKTALHCFTTDWIIDVEPTCSENGVRSRYCSYCDETFYETIPAGHDYVEGVCSRCGDIQILKTGNCGQSISYILYGSGLLEIMGSGEMTDFSSYSSVPWYSYRSSIKIVSLDETITNIPKYAFYGCSSLISISISESITSIGSYAFYNCSSITEIQLSENITVINPYTFYGCSSLNNIDIPESITSIGSYAFYNCSSITEIQLSENITVINPDTFYGCRSLKFIIIPSSVISIKDHAFKNCSGLQGIFIPESVTGITSYQFDGCQASLEIYCETSSRPSGWPSAWNYYNTTSLSALTTTFGISKREAEYWIRLDRTNSIIDIPNYITRIPDGVFQGKSFTKIIIPSSVTKISSSAFSYCSSAIEFADGTESIISKALYGANKITRIIFPDSLTSIGSSAFYGCTGLTSIELPDGIASIGSSAFRDCTRLTSIELPDSIASIGSSVFYGCTGLKSIELPDSITNIGEYAFYGCKGLKGVFIPIGVSTIGKGAFSNLATRFEIYCGASSSQTEWDSSWRSSDSIVVYDSTRQEADYWLSLNRNVESIHIPNYIMHIPMHAFDENNILKSVVLSDSVSTIGSYAFNCCSELSSVYISDGVTRMEDYAFYGCSSLTDIYIPSSVNTISGSPFYSCSSTMIIYCHSSREGSGWNDNWNRYGFTARLKVVYGISREEYVYWRDPVIDNGEIVIPTYISMIPSAAFSGMALSRIVIPSSVTRISEEAFINCSFDTVEIQEGITTISSGAFKGATGIRSILLPESVKTIEKSAFYNCKRLTSIYLPDSLESIDINAFYGCIGLKTVYIPASVKVINAGNENNSPFYECDGSLVICCATEEKPSEWDSYWYSTGNTYSGSGARVLYGLNRTDAEFWGNLDRSQSVIEIADYVACIPKRAFYNCSSLESITIPESVTSIGASAFYGCTGLLSIVIPDSVDRMDIEAFYGCTSIKSVTLSSGLTEVSDQAFYGCSSIESIIIPDGVQIIGEKAFYGCKGLKSVYIPTSVLTIKIVDKEVGNVTEHYGPFYDCKYTLVLYCEEHNEYNKNWNNYWTNGYSTNYLTVIYGVLSAEKEFWINLDKTQNEITIPATITKIPEKAFMDRTNLNSIIIPDSVTIIGAYAFSGCTGLTSLELPDSITSIGSHTFYCCSSLTSISIPENVTSIEEYTFYGCSSLTSINIPENVTTIEDYTFYGCSSLTSIDLPDSITSIGISAFVNCSSLTSIVLPDSLTSIGRTAFYGCNSLIRIDLPENVTKIGNLAFGNCSRLKWIFIPASITSMSDDGQDQDSVFYGCSKDLVICCEVEGYYGSHWNAYTKGQYLDTLYGVNRDDAEFWGCLDRTQEEIFIPDIVTSMPKNAFIGHNNLISITISSSIKYLDNNVFRDCENINYIKANSEVLKKLSYYGYMFKGTVNVSEGSLVIEPYTFSDDIELTRVILPSTIVSIGKGAFSGCTVLTGIVLQDSLTSIDSEAFHNCSSLTSISIPNGITELSSSVFSGCDSLSSVILPEGLTVIGDNAFSGCTQITSIELPKSLITIGRSAFSGCTQITSIGLPDSLTMIGEYAFSNCCIKGIYIPESVSFIGYQAFGSNQSTKSDMVIFCEVDSKPSDWDSYWNVYFVINGGSGHSEWYDSYFGFSKEDALYWINLDRNQKEITIPEGISKIPESFFSNRIIIEQVTMPGSIKEISRYVFDGCTGLKKVFLSDGIEKIEIGAFRGCVSLDSIWFPDSIISIQGAFDECTSLSSIRIPNTLETLESYVFLDCDNLTYIEAPCHLIRSFTSFVNPVVKGTFVVTSGITSYIPASAFANCIELENVIISDTITEIGSCAFQNCTSLKNIIIPDSVVSIGSSAFSGCSSLSAIDLSNKMTVIEEGLFWGCESLKSIEFTENIISIEDNAFIGCSSLTEITVPANIETIGRNAFEQCTCLKRINLSKNVTSIGGGAFYGCESLQDVYYSGTKNDRQIISYYDGEEDYNLSLATWHYQVPDAPVIRITETTSTSIRIEWNMTDNSTDYDVYRKLNNGKWEKLKRVTENNCFIVLNGGTNSFKVQAYNRNNKEYSVFSNEISMNAEYPFIDVKANAYYINALKWAYQNNVIAGTTGEKFSPDDNCTRGQLAVMIYRMFGKPSIAGKTIPFTDVKSSDYFYKAVVWAYNEGIITGTSSTKFSPNSSITRQDLVVMLWRMQNKPKVTATNPFTDVNEGMYSYKAIMWAYKVGVTSGTSATKFSPKDQCTRAQIAAFLYKYNKMFHVI